MAAVVRAEAVVAPADVLAGTGVVPPEELALEGRGLLRRYGDRLVVDVQRVGVRPGESLAVLGPNGAGKSTLFRLLALLERPDGGEVRLLGRAARHGDSTARRSMAAVFQRPVVFQGKVWKNVALGLQLRRLPRSQVQSRVSDVLDLLGLSPLAKADARSLSGGELQRVALARALVLRPEVLLLDEPTSSLDPSLRARFRADLGAAVRGLGSAMILITHDQSEALALSDRVAVMREGVVEQEGVTTQVFARPRNRFVADFLGVECVWRARVEGSSEGLCYARTRAGLLVEAVSRARAGEEVTLAMRPEDVVLSSGSEEAGVNSARNRFAGVVEQAVGEGPVVRVRVRLTAAAEPGAGDLAEGFLTALVTRPSAAALGLVPGQPVTASVKATALQVLED